MKRFHFRLQALLDVAQHRERSLQIELVGAQSAELEIRRRHEAALRLLAEWEKRIRENQKGQLDSRLLKDLLRGLEAVRQRAAKERETLRAAEQVVEGVRERLTEAARSRKSYENLRERMEKEHESADARQQIKTSDDMSAVRAATARVGGANNTTITGVPA